ncbi:hypothetical protein [Kribbella pratensis]|nr:hypothetical protein [Kribbella pratensis]
MRSSQFWVGETTIMRSYEPCSGAVGRGVGGFVAVAARGSSLEVAS